MVRHGADMALRGTGGNDKMICDLRLAGEIDDDHIFSLVVIKRCFHQFQQVRLHRCRLLGSWYGLVPFQSS